MRDKKPDLSNDSQLAPGAGKILHVSQHHKKDNSLGLSGIYKVEASAGSGKTYCLARRYVKLLINEKLRLEEIPLESILAVTFSNKAAFEMKARILELLKKLALDKFSNPKEKEELLYYLALDADFAQEKAYRIMDDIISHYNFFQVQTIDSFINAILSGCAFMFNLSASFRIEQDYSRYLSYSFDKFIDKANDDPATLTIFRNFLRQYIYLENKKKWLPKKDILYMVDYLFSLSNIYGSRFAKYKKHAEEVISKREKIRGLMLELKNNMPEGINMTTWGGFVNFFGLGSGSMDIERFFGPFSKDELKMRKNFAPSDKAVSLWKNIKDSITEFCEFKSLSLFNCYVDIFEGVSVYFEELSRKEDVMFLEELNSKVCELFDSSHITVPELYYRLATRFKHFLIDEFQDTSILQWNNLRLMVEDALSIGGSLFYVGDKKQAIYRFRGGEASLIDTVKEDFKHFGAEEQVLDNNYRSQKEIVEFNNHVFSECNLNTFIGKISEIQKDALELTAGDISEIIDVFGASQQTYKENNKYGYVKVELLDLEYKEDSGAETIKEIISGLVGELKERFLYRDIALLARSNEEVGLITSWLLEEGIPVESEKTLNIRENSFIQELVALLRFLNSPIDNLSFASFLLGDIFAKASGLSQEKVRDFLFVFALQGKERFGGYFYREFRIKFPQVWDKLIDSFFKSVGFIPLYELTSSIMGKFRVLENFPEYQGFFMKFLELIKSKEQENHSISLFLEFFETANIDDLYVHTYGGDSVKVVTIHKSKGLEFPVVIIPFLEMNVRVGLGKNKNSFFVVRREGQLLSLNYLTRSECIDFSSELRSRYKEEYKKSFIDELNSIYVAFTRAEYELYAFVQRKTGRSINLAGLLLGQENIERGKIIKYKDKDTVRTIPTIKIAPSRYEDWVNFLKDEFVDVPGVKNRQKITRGEIMHYILSCIGNLNNRDIDMVIAQALERSRLKFNLVGGLDILEVTIRALLADNKFKQFFFLENAEVFQEKEIVDSYGNTKILDRLIFKPSEVWIIDYKSSRQEGNDYKEQVEEYMRCLRSMYPKSPVKGFLIYLDDLSIEEIHGKTNKL